MDLKKVIYTLLVVVSAGIGIVGVWLPGVPTTMPILVALWAFSKSNPALGAKLEKVPILRQAISEAHRFERERSVAWQVKVVSMSSAWVSTVLFGLLTHNVLGTIVLATIAVSCSAFMLYIPTHSPTTAVNLVGRKRD